MRVRVDQTISVSVTVASSRMACYASRVESTKMRVKTFIGCVCHKSFDRFHFIFCFSVALRIARA